MVEDERVFFPRFLENRAEFVAIDNYPSFFRAVLAETARNHFNRGADFGRFIMPISELSCYQRSFLQFNQGNSIRGIFFETCRSIPDRGKGINFTFTREGIRSFGVMTALWTDITRRKYLGFAMVTDFTHQSVPLVFQAPVTGNFHTPI